ncbi:hypothetical protein JTB14_009161 [Gonioctena quinquepunctata]|nr:hypothetical protein JTB14_009161 [Gonioctena quinquepunctata]
MAYTNEEMADMHYVLRSVAGNGLEASRRYAEMYPHGSILHIEYLLDFINDSREYGSFDKERRIVEQLLYPYHLHEYRHCYRDFRTVLNFAIGCWK